MISVEVPSDTLVIEMFYGHNLTSQLIDTLSKYISRVFSSNNAIQSDIFPVDFISSATQSDIFDIYFDLVVVLQLFF